MNEQIKKKKGELRKNSQNLLFIKDVKEDKSQ